MPRNSLRIRAAVYFLALGSLLSTLFVAGAYYAMHTIGQHLLLETLQHETRHYLDLLRRNPGVDALPSSAAVRGYLISPGSSAAPQALRELPSGPHEIGLGGVPLLALVTDRPGSRLVFTIDESAQLEREHLLLYALGACAVLMTGLITLGGLWLARRAVSPVIDLAARIAASESERAAPTGKLSLDDISRLALLFEHHLERIRGCVDRERAFASDVSHELRSPLAVIRGAVEVLEEDENLSEGQRSRIARIERASHDMTELTSALLRLSREETGVAPNPDNCSIASVVRESVEKHRSLKGALTVNIDLNIVDAPLIPVEKGLATVVVDNLIGNAMLHAQSSQIQVCLERSRLLISDSGKGIAKSDLDRIFQRHYRGPGSQGSGIGLSLVKRICDLHGWEISIDSSPGQGTSAQLFFGKRQGT